jgi:hypothetical protein
MYIFFHVINLQSLIATQLGGERLGMASPYMHKKLKYQNLYFRCRILFMRLV